MHWAVMITPSIQIQYKDEGKDISEEWYWVMVVTENGEKAQYWKEGVRDKKTKNRKEKRNMHYLDLIMQ